MPSFRVDILGWQPGLRKVSMARSLESHLGLPLSVAKALTDRVLAGESVSLELPSLDAAHKLAALLRELGADAAALDSGLASISPRPPSLSDHTEQSHPVETAVTKTLYRPVGDAELQLIAASDWRTFPPRLPHQPIFYPVLTESYAVQIARDWNVRDEASGFIGHVTRFAIDAAFVARYVEHVVGASEHRELWVPAEELPAFNEHIVGQIELVATFTGASQASPRVR
jgi:hypothetical protein